VSNYHEDYDIQEIRKIWSGSDGRGGGAGGLSPPKRKFGGGGGLSPPRFGAENIASAA